MHMASREDLHSAELEMARASKSPTTVVTANGEVLTKEEATVYVRELDLFVTVMLLEDTPAVLSLGKLCEDHGHKYHWTRGQKPLLIKNGRKIDCNTANYAPFCVLGQSTSSSISTSSSPTSPTSSSQESMTLTEQPASTTSENMSEEVQRNFFLMDQQKPKTHTKNDDNEDVQGNLSYDLPEWLQEFTHGLVDESVPEHRDASSSSHELLSEPQTKVVSGKHSIFTHFTKDRNCDVCLRTTKITRASCRKGTGKVVPRAENFGDLITADHKVLSEGCESRNNHRYAVVVQDLATQWIQSYPCKTKLLIKRRRACKSSGSRRGNKKSSTQTIPENLAKLVKIFPGIIVRRQMVLLKEQYAELRKGHLQYCWYQVWTRNGGRIPGMLLLSAKRHRSLVCWEDTT